MWTRRRFMGSGLALAVGGAVGGCEPPCAAFEGFRLDPDGILDTVEGITYVVVDRVGDRMSDGHRVPGRPDGMACFERDGMWVLLRNHELTWPEGTVPQEAYDSEAGGGVTRVVVDPGDLKVLSSNLVLAGTVRNCGGGPTPWGWLSAEETEKDGHGWVFLCDPDTSRVRPPHRIDAYRRFEHEAAAFDPTTGICYLTEDQADSCLYRFVPDDPDRPFAEGRFQALAVVGDPGARTTRLDEGEVVDISWVDVPEPGDGETLRAVARRAGAAVIVRGEGAWLEDRTLVVASTAGGPIGGGQIFAVDVDRDTLSVLTVVRHGSALYRPDNVTLGPAGTVWMCEDHTCLCQLHVRTDDGCIHPIARSSEPEDELAGICFSPDGRVAFVNLWRRGITVALLGIERWSA